ncbi:hypothetical protein CWB99_15855 [Pseudoalteromonas rubra]|uniref:DUF2730 domain-containing protein n=1 Tax=Pseudoalteromonas rubra TaxID=43658 RepID=A0A5S3WKH3_9GAMM|nr:DUF2730 family protein [Pseudoalteromonas rubra]TMP27191.1 hypothetical protein CWB99_15855 [Pseudoalteromonas rubra]TMP29487.1 hypothetical protein CWC00_18950 [Pseudoalteromonas rubra]
MYDFFQKWQTLIVWLASGLGVLIMAYLYLRFPSRGEFNKHKNSAQEQLTSHKEEVLKQLSTHKAEVSEMLSDVKKEIGSDFKELERQLEKVPTKEDLHDLELKIEKLNTNIESVKPGLSNVERLTNLLMENELREKRNAD